MRADVDPGVFVGPQMPRVKLAIPGRLPPQRVVRIIGDDFEDGTGGRIRSIRLAHLGPGSLPRGRVQDRWKIQADPEPDRRQKMQHHCLLPDTGWDRL